MCFVSDGLAIGAALSVARQVIDGHITVDIRTLLSEPLQFFEGKRQISRYQKVG